MRKYTNDKSDSYVTGVDLLDVCWALYLVARRQLESRWDVYSHPQVQTSGKTRLSRVIIDVLSGLFFPYVRVFVVAFVLWRRGAHSFGHVEGEITPNRAIAKTELGYLALVPVSTLIGDDIAVCDGGKSPLVLRDGLENTKLVLGD